MKPSEESATNGHHHPTCVICKRYGQLLWCAGNGCINDHFHPHCLDPPVEYIIPGVWHCISCVRKKILFGEHVVSHGVESIWEVRQAEKKYWVKYEGLAHMHNSWIEEAELLREAPRLVSRFNNINQAIRWKVEWTVPHRLLMKRKLSFSKRDDDILKICSNEWLVKWTGLDYEQATWELESASFLKGPKALTLMKDFETRQEKAESFLLEADKQGKDSLRKSSQLTVDDLPQAYNCHLSHINQLRKYWSKGHNALCIDEHADQVRVLKIILFIISLHSNVSMPILVISTPKTLNVWEDEFLRIAPSANIVVYKGYKDLRNSIRSLEFFNKRGCIMFQVLLTSSDVVVEDFEELKYIGWEAIIMDECESSTMSEYFGKFKLMTAKIMLLVLGSQIKDSLTDYLGLLYLLESGNHGSDSNNMDAECLTDIDKAKKQMEPYIAFESKSCFSQFVEHA
ncbi:hypothetical protein ACFE04_014059 [Oxalis oulophora]